MIDVLLATYNGESYLREQLDSIIHQSFEDWHLIIRDDGSDDKTCEIISEYVCKYPERITFYQNDYPTGSAKANFIKMLYDTQAEYIMFSDQDDIWLRDKILYSLLEIQRVEEIKGKMHPALVATDLCVVDKDKNKIASSFLHYMNLPSNIILNRLLIQNNITGCTIMINKKLSELLKEVHNTGRILMHDHFAALIGCVLGSAVLLPKQTIMYRQHEKNSVGASNARSFSYMCKRLKRGKKKFKSDMEISMEQASYFLELYGSQITDKKIYHLIWEYSVLKNRRKISRIHFYIKYRILKYGFGRCLLQIMWG